MWAYFFPLVVGVSCLYQILTTAIPKLLLVPTQLWIDKIEHVMNYPKPIYLKVGMKRSSFRRRLITASAHPSFYNNFNNNKLKIHPQDCENKDNYFLDAMKHRDKNDPKRKILYGFFHPYANNGGGGERVLWQAVYATLVELDNNIAVVYTVNYEEPANIVRKAEEKFGITVDGDRIVFIYLRKYGKLIDNTYWKHFTLVGQLFGSLMLASEALFELSPDVWIDTIGLPGSYWPVYTVLKIPILAYVHYPILQQDMFNKLKFTQVSDLRSFRLSLRDLKDAFKLVYWNILYYLYVYLGLLVDITLTNGTWTYNHIKKIWFLNEKHNATVEVLYPPCGTENTEISDLAGDRENKMIYIAQFRPEKRHDLILQEYKKFLSLFQKNKGTLKSLPTLVFLGSCRTEDDTETLGAIKSLTNELELGAYVDFIVDCSYSEILHQLSKVKFGLNSMWNEHFGIGVVEYLNHGVIPIVHASAGPMLDIVLGESGPSKSWISDAGFFFKSETDPDFDSTLQTQKLFEFGDVQYPQLQFTDSETTIGYPSFSTLLMILYVHQPELISSTNLASMRLLGYQQSCRKFSNKTFSTHWMKYTRELASLEKQYRDTKRSSIESMH